LPNTNKVQVWTTEGEMLNIEKKELLQNTSDISQQDGYDIIYMKYIYI